MCETAISGETESVRLSAVSHACARVTTIRRPAAAIDMKKPSRVLIDPRGLVFFPDRGDYAVSPSFPTYRKP